MAGIVSSSAGPMRPSTEPSSALLAGAANWSAIPAMLTTTSAPAEAEALCPLPYRPPFQSSLLGVPTGLPVMTPAVAQVLIQLVTKLGVQKPLP